MELLLAEDCPTCPWDKPDYNPALDRIMYYVMLEDGGCRPDRHELNNNEWLALGAIKAERMAFSAPKPEDYGWQKVPVGANGRSPVQG